MATHGVSKSKWGKLKNATFQSSILSTQNAALFTKNVVNIVFIGFLSFSFLKKKSKKKVKKKVKKKKEKKKGEWVV